MNKEEYNKLLKDPRWKAKRGEILERDGHKCTQCGNTHRLSVHHNFYDDINPWEYKNEDLVTLCNECHKEYHRQNRNIYTNYNLLYNKMFECDDNGKNTQIETANKVTATKQLLESIQLSMVSKENNFIRVIDLLIQDVVTFYNTYNNSRISISSQFTGDIEGFIDIKIVYKPKSTPKRKTSKVNYTAIWDFDNCCVNKDALKEMRKQNKLKLYPKSKRNKL